MQAYLDLLQDVLDNGQRREDRTGTGTLSVFGRQLRFDLQAGFPLLTTKKLHTRSIVHELLWFLSGSSNIQPLVDAGVSIWNEWANEDGELGPMYGAQWRRWRTASGGEIDQIARLVESLKQRPHSRRHLVSAWNVGDLPEETCSPQDNVRAGRMALAACHTLFQCHVTDGRLSCLLYARSQDLFLGTPFNIASYALLVHLLADQCGLQPGELVWTGGDVHLYLNHLDQARLQLTRDPRPLPRLHLQRRPDSIFDYQPADIAIVDYDPHPAIPAPIAV